MLRTSNPEAREQVLRYHHLLNVSRFETYCMKNTISYLPRTKTSLFLDENVRAREGGKAGRRQRASPAVCALPMVPCGSSPVARLWLISYRGSIAWNC